MEIERKTLFIDVLRRYPRAVKEVLVAYRLPCLECKGLPQETLEHIATSNGLDVEDFLDRLRTKVKEING